MAGVLRLGDKHLSVFAPLEMVSVRRLGRHVRVGVRDTQRSRHFIDFHFAGGADARRHAQCIREWIAWRAPVAYVRGNQECALVEIDALLARAT